MGKTKWKLLTLPTHISFLTFSSWSVMMFLSAKPYTRGKGSSTAMAISVRSSLSRERRFVSLRASTLDMIRFVSKREPKWPGPKRTWDHSRGIFDGRGVSYCTGASFRDDWCVRYLKSSISHVSFHQIHFLPLIHVYIYICIYIWLYTTVHMYWEFQRLHTEGLTLQARPPSTSCLCGVHPPANCLRPPCWPSGGSNDMLSISGNTCPPTSGEPPDTSQRQFPS